MTTSGTAVVGIMSPGDMGHAIGRVLHLDGIDVIACLEGRSQRTRGLATKAGIRAVESLRELVSAADIVLSILVPDAARDAAEKIAAAIRSSGHRTHYVDCNAVAPETVCELQRIVCAAGGDFSDGSIIGLPPGTQSAPTRIYVSGPHAKALLSLAGKGIEIKQVSHNVGDASALKMCYAGITKASFALYYAAAIVSQRRGVFEALTAELEFSQPVVFEKMDRHLPRLPAKADRWVGEMEEISRTFQQAGMPQGFHQAAAEVFRLVSQSEFAKETPETIDEDRTLQETIESLARLSEA